MPMIEAFLPKHKTAFEGKRVYLPCDNPEWSNFFRFFVDRFNDWKIKELVTTFYESDPCAPVYATRIKTAVRGGSYADLIAMPGNEQIPLANGDYLGPETAPYFDEADVIVTNPPFATSPDYIRRTIDSGKQFFIIGTLLQATTKRFIQDVATGRMTCEPCKGHTFLRPDGSRADVALPAWLSSFPKVAAKRIKPAKP